MARQVIHRGICDFWHVKRKAWYVVQEVEGRV
jgi:hypothetical protein